VIWHFLSKRTIIRHFSEYFHMPAAEYITVKIRNSGISIDKFYIFNSGNQLSFSSQSHFSATFKKQYHYTPQQYRLYLALTAIYGIL